MELKIADFCKSTLDLKRASLSESYYYANLPLCVIDAVYSIGAKYTSTKNTVEYYCTFAKVPRFRAFGSSYPVTHGQHAISDFLAEYGSKSFEDAAAVLFNNKQRTSSTNGILKAEATKHFADCLLKHGVDLFQDVPHAVADKSLEENIKKIRGQSSGVSWKYFLMLAGSETLIKPDRMILRFIKRVTGKKTEVQKAQGLLEKVLKQLTNEFPNLTLRKLDHEIWKYERNTSPV